MWFPSYYELESAGVLTGAEIVVRGGGGAVAVPAPTLDAAALQRELQAGAEQINASAPTALDEYTLLTGATARGLILTRHYTVSTNGVNAEEFLLLDQSGRARAGLGLDANGEVGLILTSRDGNRTLALSPDGPIAVKLTDRSGRILWQAP